MMRAVHRSILVWLAAMLVSLAAMADDIPVRGVRLVPADDGYALVADFDVELSQRLEDALAKGVPLHFLVEFECTRPRWYWLAERVVTNTLTIRLSFHALTRSYRVSTGALHQSFESLTDAMRAVGTIRGWHVLNRGDLRPGSTYEIGVRMRLDVNQLPKPFQLSAIANREWTLASRWERWGLLTSASGEIVR